MLKTLTLEDIGLVDHGAVSIAINRALKEVHKDILDRTGLKSARKLNIALEIKPVTDQAGDLMNVHVKCSVDTRCPARSTAVVMNVNHTGFVFQTDSPRNPNQPSLPGTDPGE